eukprot:1468914-Pyramimonas_sp.AAC.1
MVAVKRLVASSGGEPLRILTLRCSCSFSCATTISASLRIFPRYFFSGSWLRASPFRKTSRTT